MPKATTAFADVGFKPSEVVILETKGRLMVALNDILDASGMTQAQAALRFGEHSGIGAGRRVAGLCGVAICPLGILEIAPACEPIA